MGSNRFADHITPEMRVIHKHLRLIYEKNQAIVSTICCSIAHFNPQNVRQTTLRDGSMELMETAIR
uniref:Uncharacterized protein n=1 Tax=Parascaris equorum TaxID=6256 RepID=A0A914S3X9_PAREQ